MIAFLLVIIAAGLLVTAFVTEMIQYGIASIAAVLISMTIVTAYMVIDARTRREQHASRDGDDEAKDGTDEDGAGAGTPEISLERSPDEEQSQPEEDAAPTSNLEVAPQVPQGEVGGSEVVRIIPGRKRFHQPACVSLAARESQELTREEAEEEGFTPCSRCHSTEQTIKRVV